MSFCHAPTRLGSALASLILALGLLGSAAGGCGQDVATCASLCAAGASDQAFNEGDSCTNDCDAAQTSCTAAGKEGDFQAYLTCLGNVGVGIPTSLVPPHSPAAVCADEIAAVAYGCNGLPVPVGGPVVGLGGGDAGLSGIATDAAIVVLTDATFFLPESAAASTCDQACAADCVNDPLCLQSCGC